MGDRLCIGGAHTVWEYRNVPAAAGKLGTKRLHDACFVPRGVHFTGNIDIHEMAWADNGELWLVNTHFSCLCTLDNNHSFTPQWRPDFITALAPEDRCHLNGLAMKDGSPAFVTALGATNSRGEWRNNKKDGGVLINIASNEILARGLSMPHSPRWYRDKLWILESGRGALCEVDLNTSETRTVAEMPGFTRGLDFIGPLAFVGLSQVRETAVFSGLPITKEVVDRSCGIWVVNIESGEIVAFLRFESGVAEIFAVEILSKMRFPELLPSDSRAVSEIYVLPESALADVETPTKDEFERAPHYFMARGIESLSNRDFAEAIANLRKCLDLQVDFPDARYNLALALAESGSLNESLLELETVCEREPDRAEFQLSLGTVQQRLGNIAEARIAFEAALRRQPDDGLAHVSLGILELQNGNYERGLAEYDWRFNSTRQTAHLEWEGEPVPGKTLLVTIDTLDARHVVLLMRLLPLVANRCERLMISCAEPFFELLSTLPGVSDIRRPERIKVDEFDVKVSLERLPVVLNLRTDTLSASSPYIAMEVLKRRAGSGCTLSATAQVQVGLAWSTRLSAAPSKGLSAQTDCPIDLLTGVTDIPGVNFSSVTIPAEADSGTPRQSWVAHTPLQESSKISDLCMLIDQLDLIIGVDSPAIHIAGALGKPAWLLLGTVFDWYWPSKNHYPSWWYPSARIFRQPTPGDWAGCVAEVRESLSQWISEQVRSR